MDDSRDLLGAALSRRRFLHLLGATAGVLASAGEMNPQIRFGEDLMSRVSYVMLNPRSERELTRAVRG